MQANHQVMADAGCWTAYRDTAPSVDPLIKVCCDVQELVSANFDIGDSPPEFS